MERIRVVVTFIAILEMAKKWHYWDRVNNSMTDFYVFKLAGMPEEV
jgi:hypothetical protein